MIWVGIFYASCDTPYCIGFPRFRDKQRLSKNKQIRGMFARLWNFVSGKVKSYPSLQQVIISVFVSYHALGRAVKSKSLRKCTIHKSKRFLHLIRNQSCKIDRRWKIKYSPAVDKKRWKEKTRTWKKVSLETKWSKSSNLESHFLSRNSRVLCRSWVVTWKQ